MAGRVKGNERLDATGRRRRTEPNSTGKRISPQECDLLWFRKILEHGPLPSSFLLAYADGIRRSPKRATERLTDLFNEDNTKHGGPYLSRPPQQFRTLDSRYNQLVYDLTPASGQALEDTGNTHQGVARPSGPWLHRFMVSCVTASVELATRARADVSFIPQHQILARAGTELRHAVEITDPRSGQRIKKDLIPDALFGLEYHTDSGNRFRFFAVECDRATEPATTTNFNRKSWLRSLLQYREYVGGGAYRDHLKLTAPLLVLNVTTDAKRQSRMLSITGKESGDNGNAYLLFQVCNAFGPVFRPPNPLHQILEGPWQRAGRKEFRIDQP